MSSLGPQFQQQSLFNAEDYTRPKDPGEMSMDEWVSRPNVHYHGTFNPDWASSPVLHAGTIGQASSRLDSVAGFLKRSGPSQRAAYYSGQEEAEDWEPDWEPQTHTGRVHAVEATGEMHPRKGIGAYSDERANAIHYEYLRNKGHEDWEVPGSVAQSMGREERLAHSLSDAEDWKTSEHPAVKALEAGQPVRYRNYVESDNSIDPRDTPSESVMIPKGGHKTWEHSVLESSRSSGMARDYAHQRIEQGKEGSVNFPEARSMRGSYAQLRLPLAAASRPGLGIGGDAPEWSEPTRRNINHIQFQTGEYD